MQTVSAAEAAQRLGVKLETVYAYVSRGLLRRVPGDDKESRFELAQVERLALRGRRSAEPKPAAWVVATELTEATADAIRYRGEDAVALAGLVPFERVAEWLWAVPPEAAAPFVAPKAAVALARSVQAALPEDAPPLERLRVTASVLGSTDPLRYDTSPAAVVAGARGLIAGLVDALPRLAAKSGATPQLAARLYGRLAPSRATTARVRVLDVAMGLCADHALSPSTLAVRIAAAQRADVYGVVQTGFGALSGALHGAASLSAEELIGEVEAGADPAHVIGAKLRRGERIPGFGHALHGGHDPRAAALLARVAETFGRSRAVDAAQRVVDVMVARGLPGPNVDWALAVLACAAGMLRGASEAIMAVARVAGWIAHALEEYRSPTRFTAHAMYVGPK